MHKSVGSPSSSWASFAWPSQARWRFASLSRLRCTEVRASGRLYGDSAIPALRPACRSAGAAAWRCSATGHGAGAVLMGLSFHRRGPTTSRRGHLSEALSCPRAAHRGARRRHRSLDSASRAQGAHQQYHRRGDGRRRRRFVGTTARGTRHSGCSDIRNCIAALADAEPVMAKLLQYRFPGDESGTGRAHDRQLVARRCSSVQARLRGSGQQMNRVLAVRGQSCLLQAHR